MTLKNVVINHPGAGKPEIAKVGVTPEELDRVPELADSYPEFSCFKELPAWGLYLRHVERIVLENVTFIARKKDYRPAIVLDDAHHVSMSKMKSRNRGKEATDTYISIY